MFFLSKVCTYTFLSPGLFVFLIILVLVSALARRRRDCIFLLVFSGLLLYLLSIRPVRDILVYQLETQYPYTTQAKADVLVVLGGDVRHNTLDNPRRAVPTDSTLQRLHFAYRLYRQKGLPIIVCGGTPLGRNTKESAVMAATLVQLGVPGAKIYQEDCSRNTRENLQNIRAYLQKKGYKKPGIITSAMHMPRAMRTASGLGIKAVALPCDYHYEGARYHFYDIFPDTNYLRENFIALKEYIGTAYYQTILLSSRGRILPNSCF